MSSFLQDSLKKTLEITNQTKRDNEELMHKYAVLKQSLIHTQSLYSDTVLRCDGLEQDKISDINKINEAQLSSERNEHESILKMMVPARELAILRSKLLEEVEKPLLSEKEELISQCESLQEDAVAAGRQCEMLSAIIDTDRKQHATQLVEKDEEIKQRMLAADQKIRALQTLSDHSGLDEKIVNLERQLTEANSHNSQLLEEVSALNIAMQDLTVQKEKAVLEQSLETRKHEGEINLMQQKLDLVAQMNRELRKEISNSLASLAQTNSQLQSLSTSKLDLERDLSQTYAELKSVQAKLLAEKSKVSDDATVKSRQNQSKVIEQQAIISDLKQRLEKERDDAQKIDLSKHHEYEKKLNEIRNQNESLLEQIQELRSDAAAKLQINQSEKSKFQQSEENAGYRIRSLQSQINRLQDEVRTSKALANSEKDKSVGFETQHRELQEELKSTRGKFKDLIEKNHSINSENEILKYRLETMTREMDDTSNKTEIILEKNRALKDALLHTEDEYKKALAMMKKKNKKNERYIQMFTSQNRSLQNSADVSSHLTVTKK